MAGWAEARTGYWGGDVLVWPPASACLLSVLCAVSRGLFCPDVEGQELGSSSLALSFPVQPQWKDGCCHLHFKTCISPHLPLIRANYTSAPNRRLPACHWDFYPVWGGEKLLP